MRLMIAGTHLAFPKYIYIKTISLVAVLMSSLLFRRLYNILPSEYLTLSSQST